jgi:hypothetical protein
MVLRQRVSLTDEARQIRYVDADERRIYGEATLVEEGIDVVPCLPT